MRLFGVIVWMVSALVMTACQPSRPRLASEPGASICLTDTAGAEMYRNHLERIARRQIDSASKVSWPQDRELCRQAYRMLVKSQRGPAVQGTSSLYLYRLETPKRVEYILLWPTDSRYSEWSTSCWYDERWKPQGVCVGV